MTIRHATDADLGAVAAALGPLAGRDPDAAAVGRHELGREPARVRTRPATRMGSSSPRRTARWSASSPPGSRSTSPGSATSTSPRARAAKAWGARLIEAVVDERASPGRHAPDPEREPGGAAVLRPARLPRGVAQSRAAARGAHRGQRPLVRLDPRPDRRHRRDRARRPPVRAAAPGRLARQHRRAAAPRLDRRLRRRLRPDPSMLRRLARELSERTGAVVSRSGSSTSRSSASSSSKPAGSSTSTSRCPSTTARCRPAT